MDKENVKKNIVAGAGVAAGAAAGFVAGAATTKAAVAPEAEAEIADEIVAEVEDIVVDNEEVSPVAEEAAEAVAEAPQHAPQAPRAAVHHDAPQPESPTAAPAAEAIIEDDNDTIMAVVADIETPEVAQPEAPVMDDDDDIMGEVVVPPADADEMMSDIDILSYADDDNVNVAIVDIDGERVVLTDTDNDGIADTMATDYNHDGIISDDEIVNIQENQIVIDALKGDPILDSADQDIAVMDDYINDANIDDFVS